MAANPPRLPDQTGTARRALGRGLAALIPGAEVAAAGSVIDIPVERIRPSSLQPRGSVAPEPLAELEASIREHGILHPVLVRPSGGGYELIAGERRWRAAAAAGLPTVPAIVRRMDDRGALEAALVENLQREDLNPIERARAYRRLVDDFGLSQDAVARRVGRSQPSIANALRLLRLPSEVQASVEAGRISEGHARALLAIEDRDRLLAAWKQVETKGLSVREAEALASRPTISREKRRRLGSISQEIRIIEQDLSEKLGTPVRILAKAGGSGEIRITFYSPEDLERLHEAIASPGSSGP